MTNYIKVNFCRFRGKCSFQIRRQGYIICTWDSTCSQQVSEPPETDIEVYQLQLGRFARRKMEENKIVT